MAQTYAGQKRIRKYFGKIREVLEMPNLIEVQKSSYDLFLNSGDGPAPREGEGIMGVFQSVFPIKDSTKPPFSSSSNTSWKSRSSTWKSASSAI